jgi:hypothetical protein
MADYYPILARAVSRLATNNAQARHEVYEHARTILVAQLGSQNSKASALNIMSERVALEGAILRVETESPSIRGTSSETLADYVPLQMNYQLNRTSEKICLPDYERSPRHQLFRLQPLAEGEELGQQLIVASYFGG